MCLDLNFYNKRVKRFFCFKVWDLYFQEKKNKSIFELSVSYKQAFTTAVTFFCIFDIADVDAAEWRLRCHGNAALLLFGSGLSLSFYSSVRMLQQK